MKITIDIDENDMKRIKEIDTIFMGKSTKLDEDHIRDIILGAIEDSLVMTRRMRDKIKDEL